MKFIDIIRLAMRIFKKNRLRTFLTVLGISVGIGSIVVLVSLGYGLQKATIGRISGLAALKTLDVSLSANEEKNLNQATVEELSRIQGVKSANPIGNLSAQVEYNEQAGDVIIWGVPENYFDLEGLAFKKGRTFSQPGEAVATSAMLELFALPMEEAIGKELTLRFYPLDKDGSQKTTVATKTVKISGIANDDTSPNIYLNFSAIKEDIGPAYALIKVEALDQAKISDIKDKINASGYQVSAVVDTVEQLNRGFRYLRIFFGVLGIVALVVAAIGMFNTMTISLLERTREIGIMKALGAADVDIWKLFLAEAGLIGFFGGIGGIVLGVISGQVVNLLFNALAKSQGGQAVNLFSSPIYFVLAILIFALLVGIITGIYPARRASRLNPINALRYE